MNAAPLLPDDPSIGKSPHRGESPLNFDRMAPVRLVMQRNLLLTSLAGSLVVAAFATLVGNSIWLPTLGSLAVTGVAALLSRLVPTWGAVWATQALFFQVLCLMWAFNGTPYREIAYVFIFGAGALATILADYRALALFLGSLVVFVVATPLTPWLVDPVSPFDLGKNLLFGFATAITIIALIAVTQVRITLWRRDRTRRNELVEALAEASEAKVQAEAQAQRAEAGLAAAQTARSEADAAAA
ncbi:MAG: hypothetical protein AAF264_10890, partial [Pseudomonadota bacterium]